MRERFVILIADDDPNDLFLLRKAMPKDGLEVREVADGEEVIEYLSGNKTFSDRERFPLPDLILLDFKMPLMNGLEVLDWLREHPKMKRIPTVMLSGSGMQPEIEKAYRSGVNTYFRKPMQFEKLRKLVRLMLDYWGESERPVEHRLD